METLAGIASIVGVGGTLTVAIWALVATRAQGKAERIAAERAKDIETLQASNAERAAALINEKERGDGLAAAVAKYAAIAVGPVPGTLAELQKAVADFHRAASGARVVPDAGPASEVADDPVARADDDGLLRPGE